MARQRLRVRPPPVPLGSPRRFGGRAAPTSDRCEGSAPTREEARGSGSVGTQQARAEGPGLHKTPGPLARAWLDLGDCKHKRPTTGRMAGLHGCTSAQPGVQDSTPMFLASSLVGALRPDGSPTLYIAAAPLSSKGRTLGSGPKDGGSTPPGGLARARSGRAACDGLVVKLGSHRPCKAEDGVRLPAGPYVPVVQRKDAGQRSQQWRFDSSWGRS